MGERLPHLGWGWIELSPNVVLWPLHWYYGIRPLRPSKASNVLLRLLPMSFNGHPPLDLPRIYTTESVGHPEHSKRLIPHTATESVHSWGIPDNASPCTQHLFRCNHCGLTGPSSAPLRHSSWGWVSLEVLRRAIWAGSPYHADQHAVHDCQCPLRLRR